MRDDFTQKTKDILAQRVAYHCSNPDCRCHTCMPGSNSDNVIRIGEAAHISAASEGGPRYDPSMTPAKRKHIDNAIWLCRNCAAMIDRDEKKFPILLLKQWKEITENWVQGKKSISDVERSLSPFVDIDFVNIVYGRIPHGYSSKNLKQMQDVYPSTYDFIQNWTLYWEFSMILYNNSDVSCYDLSLIPIVDKGLKIKTNISRVNHIDRLENITLDVRYEMSFEGTHLEADALLYPKIPEALDGTRYLIKYVDSNRIENVSEFEIKKGDCFTNKLI
ncbi:MAG: hypothetical protein ACK5N4_19805 [Parabacteroides gordonii]|uniref:hypothetical protein n=1 Tax=Parabacteroides gordonii TaxID=574930 RepID=UPI003A857041